MPRSATSRSRPPSISVPLGSTVTWRNAGAAPHTVTAEDGSFDSEMIVAGGSWARTFETAGTYTYVCAFHPQMEGVVEVTAGAAAAAPPAAALPSVSGTPDPSPSPSPTISQSASPAGAAVAPAATQPPLPTEAASATAAVSTQGPTFGGELMVRFVIVGVLIGGAFLLFVRAVGGSVRRGPDEA